VGTATLALCFGREAAVAMPADHCRLCLDAAACMVWRQAYERVGELEAPRRGGGLEEPRAEDLVERGLSTAGSERTLESLRSKLPDTQTISLGAGYCKPARPARRDAACEA
jgi:hypothetical protein